MNNDKETAMQERINALEDLIRTIDSTLRVPAAEYVPAIQDVFELIDQALTPKDQWPPVWTKTDMLDPNFGHYKWNKLSENF